MKNIKFNFNFNHLFRLLVLFLSLFLNYYSLFAQIDTSVYYPLSKGNKWEYFNGQGFPEYYQRNLIEVENDTTLRNGKTYSIIKTTTIYSSQRTSKYSYQRVENNCRVYEYIDSIYRCGADENLLFDFSAPEKILWPICGYLGMGKYMGPLYKKQVDFGIYKNLETIDFFYRVNIYNKGYKIDTVWWILDIDNYHRIAKGFGIVRYREDCSLCAYLINGVYGGTFTNVSNSDISHPTSFKLLQAYPNPFNPSTTICYVLKDPGRIKLSVFDILGREVKLLVNGYSAAGEHTAVFTPDNSSSSGIYLVQLQQGENVLTTKIIFQK